MVKGKESNGNEHVGDIGLPQPEAEARPEAATGWTKSVADSLKSQTGAWFVGFVISVLALFSLRITEDIKFALNSADLRTKNYEELASNLSEYNFEAELFVEFIANGWTDAVAMTPLVNEYNNSIDTLRKKEYVYLSWINRYWGKSKMTDIEGTYAAVKAFDAATYTLNDELGEVNIAKTKQKMDPAKVSKALERLRPALVILQEQSKKLLMELQ